MNRILALNLLLILVLSACSSTASVSPTDLPTDLPSPIPPTNTPVPTPKPTDTPTPVPQTKTFPQTICCNGKTVEAGEYEIPSWVGIPLTMALDEGWREVNEEAALLFMLGKGRNSFRDPTQVLVFIALPDGNPQAVLTSIRNSKELLPESEITEIMIAGFSGLQVDVSAKPNPGYEGDKEAEILPGSQFLPAVNGYFTPGFLWTTWTPESYLRFIVIDLGEHQLLIEIESPPTEFEAFAGETDQVLQSLKLRR